MEWEGVDWISLAQGRDKWWTVVNTITNLWFWRIQRISWLSEELLAT
jgi:hypothetical protein